MVAPLRAECLSRRFAPALKLRFKETWCFFPNHPYWESFRPCLKDSVVWFTSTSWGGFILCVFLHFLPFDILGWGLGRPLLGIIFFFVDAGYFYTPFKMFFRKIIEGRIYYLQLQLFYSVGLRDAPFDFWGGGGLDYYFQLCFFFWKISTQFFFSTDLETNIFFVPGKK